MADINNSSNLRSQLQVWLRDQWTRIPAVPRNQPGSYDRGYSNGMGDILRGMQSVLDKVTDDGPRMDTGVALQAPAPFDSVADSAHETSAKARKCHANMYSDPPQDCDAPYCGCNPAWSECMEMLQEIGWQSPDDLKAMGLERTKDGWRSHEKASAPKVEEIGGWRCDQCQEWNHHKNSRCQQCGAQKASEEVFPCTHVGCREPDGSKCRHWPRGEEKASAPPAEAQCSWGCHYVGDKFICYAACTVHGASQVNG